MLDEAGPGTEPMKIAGPDGAGSGEVSLRRNPPARVVALGSCVQAVIVTPQSKRPSLSTGPFRGDSDDDLLWLRPLRLTSP
jgi:hypothetical protein